jgi:hypothetical protein
MCVSDRKTPKFRGFRAVVVRALAGQALSNPAGGTALRGATLSRSADVRPIVSIDFQ